ncbi:hypothetical protein ASPCAL13498 [Aspergillus calidoustus]|uniref:Integral membrane protein n=1 Tax=Aspergillus calidoustus TaxID=454130 RepID=A0A0U5CHU4_ASPCI|nr:hypothetical protein ASPCAL13498 [Aspergillus calidoustus]
MLRRIGVACIFLISFVSLGCCIGGTELRYKAMSFEDLWLSVRFQALLVAEVNIGIFCACVPVFVALLKTWVQIAESALTYLRQHLACRGSKEAVEMGNSDVHSPTPPAHDHYLTQKIASGTLTRLKSMFHRAGHDSNQSSEGLSQLTQFPELRSVDYDYHVQIWRYSPRGRERSLIPAKRHTRATEGR